MSNNPDRNLETSSNPRDHLANERTFLSWIRTCIGIMAFGFVVEKFSLFVKQITYFLGSGEVPVTSHISASFQGYSSIFGIGLVALGAVISVLAFIKYRKIENQIKQNIYEPSSLLDIVLTLSVILIAIFLVIYLINSI